MKREIGLASLLVAMVAVVSFVNPAFLSPTNLRDMLLQVAPFAVLACGMTFVVVLGEIDISVGSMVGLLAALYGVGTSPSWLGLSPALVVPVVFLIGGILGLVNGAITVVGRVPSIIVTLGTLAAFHGATGLVLRGEWVGHAPGELWWSRPAVTICVATLVAAGAAIVAVGTPLGLRSYAAGGNPDAAAVRGLRVGRLKVFAFVTLGALSALAALMSVAQVSVIESGLGGGWELFVVTCVVVGGVSIKGGKGSVVGVLLGVLLLGTVRSALLFLKLGDDAVYWERAVQGAFIIAAVLADRFSRRKP